MSKEQTLELEEAIKAIEDEPRKIPVIDESTGEAPVPVKIQLSVAEMIDMLVDLDDRTFFRVVKCARLNRRAQKRLMNAISKRDELVEELKQANHAWRFV